MRTVYRAPRVRTPDGTPASWILVDGRRIALIGAGDPPPADATVDLPGATILPGFIDAHVHLAGTGMSAGTPAMRSARSASELLAAAHALVTEGGRATLAHGWDESTWGSPTLPTVEELDAASGAPMILVRVDGHMSLTNRAALERSGAAAEPGVDLDAHGAPTGVIRGAANRALQRWAHAALDRSQVAELQLRGARIAASAGVTTVHEMSMIAERGMLDVEVLLSSADDLPVRVVPYVATTDISIARGLGLPRIGGDLPFDGSIGARTAWVTGGYLDAPGPGAGSLSADDLYAFFRDGNAADMQVGIHAIGDGAIEAVIAAWARVASALDADGVDALRRRRHRIEHVEMPSPSAIERMAKLGIACSVQPSFDAAWGGPEGMYARALGERRAASMNPFRSMREAGIAIGLGSDAPITALDPIASISAAENHSDPGQRIARAEALELASAGSARLAHLESTTGSLRVGLDADLVAYDGDPFSEPLEGLRPFLVVSRGRVVHRA